MKTTKISGAQLFLFWAHAIHSLNALLKAFHREPIRESCGGARFGEASSKDGDFEGGEEGAVRLSWAVDLCPDVSLWVKIEVDAERPRMEWWFYWRPNVGRSMNINFSRLGWRWGTWPSWDEEAIGKTWFGADFWQIVPRRVLDWPHDCSRLEDGLRQALRLVAKCLIYGQTRRKMRIVKVLFLDDVWVLPNLTSYGIEFEEIRESQWNTNVYSAPVEVCEAVKKLTAAKAVDIVVIGNNMGAGVAKAKAVADDMKEMTVVVWNSYHQGVERPYASFGLKRFGARTDIRQLILAMLGIVA